MRKPVFRVYNTNHAVQSQKMVRIKVGAVVFGADPVTVGVRVASFPRVIF